jgi:hypothetical protein
MAVAWVQYADTFELMTIDSLISIMVILRNLH